MELYDWQKDALKELEKNGYCGIVQAVTGTGKTTVGLTALKQLRQRTLIVVPTIALMNQWKDEVLKIGVKEEDVGLYYGELKQINKVTIAVINSVYERNDLSQHFSLLILDEIHRFAANNWQRFLLNNSFKYRIGLTATLERNDGAHDVLIQKIGDVVYKYTTTLAVKDKLLNKFTIVNVGLDLPKSEKEYLERLDRDIKIALKDFDNDFNNVLEAVKHYNRKAGRVLKLVNERKQFYNKSLPKVEKAINVIVELMLQRNKIIVFGEYIDVADILYKKLKERGVNSWVYYSGNDKSIFKLSNQDKAEIIQSYKQADRGVLITVKALDEGLDVKDANIGVLLGYNKTSRQAIQRMGRILRKAEGKHPVMYSFFYRNTSDYWNAKNFCDNFTEAGEIQWK